MHKKKPHDLYIGNTGKLRKGAKKPYPSKLDFRSGEALRKLDPSRMSKAQREAYQKEALRDDPNQLVRPLTPYLLDKETDAALRIKYGGQERELQGQIGASAAQQARIGSWYDDYKKAIAQSEQRVAQANTEALTALQTNTQRSTDADAQNRAQIAQQQAQSAATRGATTDPAAELRAAQAAAARRQTSDSQMALQTAQGTNARNSLIDAERIASMAKVGAHEQESARERQVRAALAALEGEKGDYALQYRAQARGNERQFGLQNEALGINKDKAARDNALAASLISDRTADNKRQAAKDKRDAKNKALALRIQQNKASSQDKIAWAKLSETTRHNLASEATAAQRAANAAKGKDKPRLTPGRKNEGKKGLGKARSLLGTYDKKELTKNGQAKIVAMLAGKGIDSSIALAAYQEKVFRGVGPKTRKDLRKRYGLKLKGFPAPSASSSGGGSRGGSGAAAGAGGFLP